MYLEELSYKASLLLHVKAWKEQLRQFTLENLLRKKLKIYFTCGRIIECLREASDQQLDNGRSVVVHLFGGSRRDLASNPHLPAMAAETE